MMPPLAIWHQNIQPNEKTLKKQPVHLFGSKTAYNSKTSWLSMSASEPSAKGVSVVTTAWNERENIEELIRRIRQTLAAIPHEEIVVDDTSTDGTLEVAKRYADIAVGKTREGQTKGLLFGAQLAKYPIIVTIDSDLENSPELIPNLIEKLGEFDVVVGSRSVLPRVSERWASKTLGKLCGVYDFYSNFRAFKREAIVGVELEAGETFGGELLVKAKKQGFRIGEVCYEAPPRRSSPRIGNTFRANWRISVATLKCLRLYLF
jgi:glycosyltransferase involved in cell wall biosynthesis